MQVQDSSPLGLYVHIPFCSIKCYYCDFAAFSGQNAAIDRYLRALEREAALYKGRAPGTLYVGGGTPSELSAGQTAELFALIRRSFPRAQFEEITFEANPESLTPEKLSALKAAGVTRLSLGLQTMDQALLKDIGRRHTPQDFLRTYEQARRASGWAVSVDLMYGLPGQTLAQSQASLDAVLALEPEHLSLYGLQVEDRTQFGKRGVEPDEDLCRRMFEDALGRIARAGLSHYEISNFARSGHQSVHNKIYWQGGDYIGLGCSAASYISGERWTNAERLTVYCDAVENGRSPAAQRERLSGREKLGEEAFVGLRLIDGFTPSPELRARFAPQWKRLVANGLVEPVGRGYRLTREGVFLANQAFSEFVAPFDDAPMPVLEAVN